MWVTRIRINGGFLNGLDLSFVRGLNVVIGPRGVGKTTMLELLRHAIGVEHADRKQDLERGRFLSAVLGAGEVIVDLSNGDTAVQVIVDAQGRGRDRKISRSALVLGQSELEQIASNASSRLNLFDLRAGQEPVAISRLEVAELSRELFDLRGKLRECRETAGKRQGLEADREIYRLQEEALVGDAMGPLAGQRDKLKVIEGKSTMVALRLTNLSAAQKHVDELAHEMVPAKQSVAKLDSICGEFISDDHDLAGLIAELNSSLEQLKSQIDLVGAHLQSSTLDAKQKELGLREEAAPIREKLEQAEDGLGQLTAQIRNVDAQLKVLDENDKKIALLKSELSEAENRRNVAFSVIEEEEERLYQARHNIAQETSQQISSHIAVIVEHLADHSGLRELLTQALRGTHTRGTLIEELASRVIPRTLLELVETNDVAGLASVGSINEDQAARVIAALDSPDSLASLAQVSLKDRVDFLLRDNAVEKSVDVLSSGQKCAVTLPIVLSERERALILDQPEDHLDNKYLVDHVVSAMEARTRDGVQTIVATHNANIPVLGGAGRVFVLGSDGKHGEVLETGSYDSPEVVASITSIMEGGREAFARRAEFYGHNG